MIITIAYTGLRWGEAIGLEREFVKPGELHVEWQLRELGGRFHRIPPKEDSYRSPAWEPCLPVDLPSFLDELLTPPVQASSVREMCLYHRPRRNRALHPHQARRAPLPTQQLRPPPGHPPSPERSLRATQRPGHPADPRKHPDQRVAADRARPDPTRPAPRPQDQFRRRHPGDPGRAETGPRRPWHARPLRPRLRLDANRTQSNPSRLARPPEG
jgi:hypothetical protein